MLKKWIDEIRNKPDLYKTDCWKYHITGNVIGLSILPGYLKQKKLYRCSVIAVGQVLHALSTNIEQEHLNFHIQSFPSLETPEIVASIRMDEKGEFAGKFRLEEKIINHQQNASAVILKLAKLYQLEIKEVEHPKNQTSEDIPFKDYTTWFVIYSTFNNPFTWLNIGYLKESLKNEYSNQPRNEDLYIADLCSLGNDHRNFRIPENKYLQSLIGVQTRNVSAG